LEKEFLPAAAEILEHPPERMHSTLVWVLSGMVLVGLACSWFGKLDVVAVAQGRVLPHYRAVPVRPLDTRKIHRVFIAEGEHVEAGQQLIELESIDPEVDVKQAETEAASARASHGLLRSAVEALDSFSSSGKMDFSFLSSDGIPEASQQYAYELAASLRSELSALKAEHEAIDDDLKRLDVSEKARGERIQLYESIVPLREESHLSALQLQKTGGISRDEWRTKYEEFLTAQSTLSETKIEIFEIDAQRSAARARQRSTAHELRRKLQERLVEEVEKRDRAELILRRARNNYAHAILKAPQAGRVQQLAVYSPGTVVQAGEVLLSIIPDGAELEILARASNSDAGWITPGMKAKIKVASFPYTRFGTLSATVLKVGADGIQDEKTGEVYFEVIFSLEKPAGAEASFLTSRLQPGLTCQAEVMIRKMRLLEVWLSPLQRHLNEGFREL
jgi:hemolysin D